MSFKSWAEEHPTMYSSYGKKLDEAFGISRDVAKPQALDAKDFDRLVEIMKEDPTPATTLAKKIASDSVVDTTVSRRVTAPTTPENKMDWSKLTTGHTHVATTGTVTLPAGSIQTHGTFVGSGAVTTTQWNPPQYVTSHVISNLRVKIQEDAMRIYSPNGEPIMEFKLTDGTISFNEGFNLDMVTKSFWEAIAQADGRLVSQSEIIRLVNEKLKLAEELAKTKDLVNKLLKELTKKYQGDEEDV